jgi:hypothetical protein
MEREEWERLRHDSESEPGEIEDSIVRINLREFLWLWFVAEWEIFRNWVQARFNR